MNENDEHPFPPCTSIACQVDDNEKNKYAGKPPCALSDRCVAACEAYGKVCPCAARVASHAACDAMKDLTVDSQIFSCDAADFPHFEADDLVIKEKIGSGGFSNVNRCLIAENEYAVKYLKKQAMVELKTFKHGAADLAVEAFFLHTLNHKNIVKLHGVTAGSVENNFASGRECGFFIVVDFLQETLEQRIEKYKLASEPTPLMTRIGMGSEARREQKESLMERLRIALEIADAMEYLHSKEIVFRDLKPDNIGFDRDGVLKLFDFGLAKELKENLKKHNDKYNLTGNTGSRRYMAPEVAKECPYDKSVDVYSFGILLWELCCAKKPFYGYSSNKHMQLVVLGGERPPLDSQYTGHWPQTLKWLVQHCWSAFPTVRPDFTTIKEILMNILNDNDSLPECAKAIKDEVEAAKERDVPCKSRGIGLFSRSPAKTTTETGKRGLFSLFHR